MSAAVRVSLLSCVLALFAGRDGTADDVKEEKPVELNVGDKAPAFEARTDGDATWESAARFGKRWVVVYFYPGDFTPGCTAQANAFRDAMNKLTDNCVEVVGVSGDSVQIHALFKKAQKLNFTLLADEEGKVARKFGVPVGPGAKVKAKDADGNPLEFKREVTLSRWTFIIDADGKVAYKNVKVTPADDAKKVTDFITKALQK